MDGFFVVSKIMAGKFVKTRLIYNHISSPSSITIVNTLPNPQKEVNAPAKQCKKFLIKCSENPLNMHERDLNFNWVVCIIMLCTWVVIVFQQRRRFEIKKKSENLVQGFVDIFLSYQYLITQLSTFHDFSIRCFYSITVQELLTATVFFQNTSLNIHFSSPKKLFHISAYLRAVFVTQQ